MPWLLDVKDNADIYVPSACAGRWRGGCAGYSRAAEQCGAPCRCGQRAGSDDDAAEIVYSGVDSVLLPAAPAAIRKRYVTLVGGLYHRELVDAFVDGVADVQSNVSGSSPVAIVHLGTQMAMLELAARSWRRRPGIERPATSPPTDMAATLPGVRWRTGMCSSAAAFITSCSNCSRAAAR